MTLIRRVVPGGSVTVGFPAQGRPGFVQTEFFDGSVTRVNPSLVLVTGNQEEVSRNLIEDELIHHFVAMALQWPASLCLWRRAHLNQSPPSWRDDLEWPYAPQDEETLADSLLAYLATGEPDPTMALHRIWGPRLRTVTAHLVSWLRPWVEAPLNPLPLPLHPEQVSFPLEEALEEDDEVPMGRAARGAWA